MFNGRGSPYSRAMKPTLFDSHINLHGDVYDDDREEVMARARAAGVERFISICDKIENFETIKAFSKSQANMWCTVGVHPHYAKDHRDLTSEQLIKLASDPVVCGIGETGLDFHYGYSPEDEQVQSFRAHIEASRTTGLPLVVHTREADELTGDILEEETRRGAFPILMHCYTSGQELADRAAALGAYFSVSGIVTFKKADDVREVSLSFPLDRVILETDCPYLAPTPHRGRRNEPSYLTHICESFAELRGVSPETMAEQTTQNCLKLFGRTQ